MAESASKSRQVVNPSELFVDWEFPIGPHFYSAFDLLRTDRVQRATATTPRHVARVWTQGSPPNYDFHEGDLFINVTNDAALQVRAASPAEIRFDALHRDSTDHRWVVVGQFLSVPASFVGCLQCLRTGILRAWPA